MIPNSNGSNGVWGESGVNELNVAISETETISSNARMLGVDPLVKDGIGEEDFLTIVLPYIKSAREGVLRLGMLLEKYGTYEMNGIAFQDENEVWWLETIGGHHWIARRVPDNCYVVNPNQQGIDFFDFDDAEKDKKEHICSSDLYELVEKNHLNVGGAKSTKNHFDIRAAFGSKSDFDHVYNTPRAWFMLKYLNPKTFKWEGPDAKYTPESDDLPWCIEPEKLVTVEDIKYLMSSYFQGTKYNPYGRFGDLSEKGKYRYIGINRTGFCHLTQIRGYLSDKLKPIQWIGFGCCAFNAFIPQYARVNNTPAYLNSATDDVNTDTLYWSNRLIAALADSHYQTAMVWVDRYQNEMAAKGHEFINSFDKKNENPDEKYLEEANETIAQEFKKATTSCLGKVLFVASNEMKNSFARSDA